MNASCFILSLFFVYYCEGMSFSSETWKLQWEASSAHFNRAFVWGFKGCFSINSDEFSLCFSVRSRVVYITGEWWDVWIVSVRLRGKMLGEWVLGGIMSDPCEVIWGVAEIDCMRMRIWLWFGLVDNTDLCLLMMMICIVWYVTWYGLVKSCIFHFVALG